MLKLYHLNNLSITNRILGTFADADEPAEEQCQNGEAEGDCFGPSYLSQLLILKLVKQLDSSFYIAPTVNLNPF